MVFTSSNALPDGGLVCVSQTTAEWGTAWHLTRCRFGAWIPRSGSSHLGPSCMVVRLLFSLFQRGSQVQGKPDAAWPSPKICALHPPCHLWQSPMLRRPGCSGSTSLSVLLLFFLPPGVWTLTNVLHAHLHLLVYFRGIQPACKPLLFSNSIYISIQL